MEGGPAEPSGNDSTDRHQVRTSPSQGVNGCLGLSESGIDGTGTPLASGHYRFEIENLAAGDTLGVTQVESYQRVEEAQMIDGQILLLLAGGQPVLPADVIGLRS